VTHPFVLRLMNVFKGDLSCITQFYVSKGTSFGPCYGPPSDLYTRTHGRNYTIICI